MWTRKCEIKKKIEEKDKEDKIVMRKLVDWSRSSGELFFY